MEVQLPTSTGYCSRISEPINSIIGSILHNHPFKHHRPGGLFRFETNVVIYLLKGIHKFAVWLHFLARLRSNPFLSVHFGKFQPFPLKSGT